MVSRQTDKNSTETRVYKYALRSREPFPEEAIEELKRSKKLWNRLVEIHKENFTRWIQAHNDVSPEHKRLDAKLEALNHDINEAYKVFKKTRMVEQTRSTKKSPEVYQAQKQIDALKAERKNLSVELKKARKDVSSLIDTKEFNREFNAKIKEAYRDKNLKISGYTYPNIIESFRNARKQVFSNPGSKLRKHTFDGTGYINYTFPKNLYGEGNITINDLFTSNKETNRRLEITGRSPHANGKKEHFNVRLCLVGKSKKDKIIRDFILTYHRPIPENGNIKHVKLLRERTGDNFKLFLAFSVDFKKESKSETLYKNAIGIDIGFREFSGNLRVAVMASTNMTETPKDIYVPKILPLLDDKRTAKTSKYQHMEQLKSDLDLSANDLDQSLKPLLKANPLDDNHEKYRLWKSAAKTPSHVTLSFETAYKLARWVLHCRKNPEKNMGLTKDAENLIMSWWRQNSRKYREMHNIRAKVLDHRKHYYRKIASDLIKSRLPIVVEKNFLANIAEIDSKSTDLSDKARGQRFIAAPSELIAAIENAAKREGIPFIKVNPRNTSKTCFACGAVNKALKGETIWTCPACSATHDRDHNAARNIAKAGLEQVNKAHKNEGE